jgi:hypothetical protein
MRWNLNFVEVVARLIARVLARLKASSRSGVVLHHLGKISWKDFEFIREDFAVRGIRFKRNTRCRVRSRVKVRAGSK